MKPAAVITILILLAGTISGVAQWLRLKELEQEHSRMLTEARKLGWNERTAKQAPPGQRSGGGRHRPVADPDDRIRQVSVRLLALAKQEADSGEAFGPQSSAGWQTLHQLLGRTLDWDEDSLCKLLDLLESEPDFRGTFAARSIGFLMQRLADKAPMVALERAVAAVDSLNSEPHLREIVGRALAGLAMQNPEAALAWFRSHQNGHATLGGHSAAAGLFKGLSKSDPAGAFSLAAEGPPAFHHQRISAVIMGAQTPEEHREVLARLREHLAGIESAQTRSELLRDSMDCFAQKCVREGFSHAMKWLATLELEPLEIESFANRGSWGDLGSDSGLWIEWVATNLSARRFEDVGGSLIGVWTNRDHQEVGEWLRTFPESPARLVAVSRYADAVARVYPEEAARILMSVSDEAERQTAMEPMLRNLSFYHPDKAARFLAELETGDRSPSAPADPPIRE